jgi:hypothetical protein
MHAGVDLQGMPGGPWHTLGPALHNKYVKMKNPELFNFMHITSCTSKTIQKEVLVLVVIGNVGTFYIVQNHV